MTPARDCVWKACVGDNRDTPTARRSQRRVVRSAPKSASTRLLPHFEEVAPRCDLRRRHWTQLAAAMDSRSHRRNAYCRFLGHNVILRPKSREGRTKSRRVETRSIPVGCLALRNPPIGAFFAPSRDPPELRFPARLRDWICNPSRLGHGARLHATKVRRILSGLAQRAHRSISKPRPAADRQWSVATRRLEGI